MANKNDTPSNLLRLTACRFAMITSEPQTLSTKYNVWATNQPPKPPLEGVSLSRRLNRENTLKRALAVPVTRATYGRITNRLKRMASLRVKPPIRNRSYDGQGMAELSHLLPHKLIRTGQMDQIIQLIHETAKQIAAHNEKQHDAKWLINNKDLHDEIDTYLKIYKQIAIMKASKEFKNG